MHRTPHSIDFETSTGWTTYTAYATTPQQAELNAASLYKLQHPQGHIYRALRLGSLTSTPYTKPAEATWD